ncbi:MAG: flagellar basal-body MS-ring/collar protein FliF [Actinomycetota bacterium]|nr:flagellar basal-body MS-ring/collar protein FliF [Actinomycetota bacterium]
MATNNAFARAQQNTTRFLQSFSMAQRVVILVGVAAVVVGSLFFMKVASKPSYAPLFTNLSASDAAAMTQKLQASGVPYQLANGGDTILVPQSMVYQERIDMAQAGLPANSTVGLSLLDKVGITTSQITQQADYQQALQGELASTIESISGITNAQVNLALPPTDVFAISQSQNPSASVLVTLSPGASLSPQQAQAIVHLVASSIPNLSPSNVTVVDQNGNILAAPGFNDTASLDTSATTAFDTQLESELTSLLQNAAGAGHVAVKVSAQLNFNQTTTKSQTIQTSPKGTPVTVPTQTSSSTQTYTGNGTVPGGVLGSITPASGNNQTSNYNQKQTQTSYAVGQVNQTTQQAPGQIQRLSVAVLIDSAVKGINVAQIKSLVAAAAGISAQRGDTVSVVRMPFAASTSAVKTSGSLMTSVLPMAKTALLALALVAVVFLILRSGGKRNAEAEGDEEDDVYPGALPTGELTAIGAGIPATKARVSEVADFIENRPDDVAKLLRLWMSARQ